MSVVRDKVFASALIAAIIQIEATRGSVPCGSDEKDDETEAARLAAKPPKRPNGGNKKTKFKIR
jgi:hypothetical protein